MCPCRTGKGEVALVSDSQYLGCGFYLQTGRFQAVLLTRVYKTSSSFPTPEEDQERIPLGL